MWNQFLANRSPHGLIAPGTAGDQLLQALRVDSLPLGHRLDRLPMAGHQQPLDIARGRHTPFASTQTGNQRNHKPGEVTNVFFPKLGVPFHTPSVNQARQNVNNYLT
jgi:hypothetical protein